MKAALTITVAVFLFLTASTTASTKTYAFGVTDHWTVKQPKAKHQVRIGHNRRYRVAQTLRAGLAGTPLANKYWLIEAQGFKYDVNPYLVAAISGTESSFGEAACDTYNAWGWGSCTAVYFSSWTDAIHTVTETLHDDYGISPGNPSITTVGTRYAACGSCWGEKTAYFMGRFGANGTWLRYPG